MLAEHLKILIVEDNDADAEIIKRILCKNTATCQFTIVLNAAAFTEALDNFKPDLVISDNSLPQFSASEALEIFKQRKLHIPFILVTGTVSEEFAANIIKAGADDYLLKDRLARLPAAIEAALKQKQTEKEKGDAAEKLKQSEEKYRVLFFNNPMPCWVIEKNTAAIQDVNNAALAHYGYTRREFLALELKQLRSQDEYEKLEKFRQSAQVNLEGDIGVWRHLKKDGTSIYVELKVHGIIYNNLPCRMILANDITEKVKTQNEIKETSEKLRELTAHLLNIREEERKRIGREIHDELGQQLTAIKMDVAWIEKKITDDTILVKNKLKNIITLLDGSNMSIRRILNELRPGILEDYGLIEALKWLHTQFSAASGIPVNFKTNLKELQLTEALSICIYRVFQEALNNIAKYSGAQKVTAGITVVNNIAEFFVEDDGAGFYSNDIKAKKSFGILGMRERVLSVNGNFDITSIPGQGTTINITIPI